MEMTLEAYLAHYGTPRHSGRYPWGSGGDVVGGTHRNKSFLDHVNDLKKQGMTEQEIAQGMNMSTTDFRAIRTHERAKLKRDQILTARKLKDKGMSNGAIAEKMGLSGESKVRDLLAPTTKEKNDILFTTSDMLRAQVDEKGFIDVGTSAGLSMNLADTKLHAAVTILKQEGYSVHSVQVPQLGMGPGNNTTVKVLCKPGTTYGEAVRNRDKIQSIDQYTEDGGRSYLGVPPPINLSSKRIRVRYAEDGGTNADGVLYVRPGVRDVSLGASRYAQVRVAVDNTHYMKGMAIYKDDLPPGVDVIFNTNKKRGTPMMGPKDNTVLKPMEDDPNLPFGTIAKPLRDDKGKPYSTMNILNEEGKWDDWSRNLPSQFLSKQNQSLAKSQLDLTYETHRKDLDDILALTNPAVKIKLLESYSDSADAAAVHLKAAQMPRQSTHVILPVESMKPTEVYAPNFNSGDRVALVRFPHGGRFEIAELTVNNKQPDAKKLLGNSKDAIGIHSKVAEKLSGADFDGDTVLVIPNNHGLVQSSPTLKKLENFDPKSEYPKYDGMAVMTKAQKGQKMGDISNLITDMTIKGASTDELARAVKHSMVVIDAEKHQLDWKRSEEENGIKALKAKYQRGPNSGADTLISRAKSPKRVPEEKLRRASEGGPIDPKTGEKVYIPTGSSYIDKHGKTVERQTKYTQLGYAKDAHSLSSGTPMEGLYADHSNRMKALANEARLAMINTPPMKASPSATKAYSTEVARLNSALNLAKQNQPRERQAQLLANAQLSAIRQANPDLDKDDIKKIKFQALEQARARTGARRQRIDISQEEWNAIQAGAISHNKLQEILRYADLEQVQQYATPKKKPGLTATQKARAHAMLDSGYSSADVASAIGVSVNTLKGALGEAGNG